jgi:hypothetical protein
MIDLILSWSYHSIMRSEREGPTLRISTHRKGLVEKVPLNVIASGDGPPIGEPS